MTRGNRLLECPECEEPTLKVIGSDSDENNIGFRRYQCKDCRGTFTTIETFFKDDRDDPDCFNQIALNLRIANREKYHILKGHSKPRKALKSTDQIRAFHSTGKVTLIYKRNPRIIPLNYECKRGHLLSKDNVYINATTGHRQCKECRRMWQRGWNDKHREQRAAIQRAYDLSRIEKRRIYDRNRRARKKEEHLNDQNGILPRTISV